MPKHFRYAKTSRQILIESLWILFSFGLAFGLVYVFSGRSFSEETIDIYLHDTMFIISRWHILILLFFLVTFVVYFVKEFRKSFTRALSNWLLVITGLALLTSLSFLITMVAQLNGDAWTLYPPLSSLGPDKVSDMTQDPVVKYLTNAFAVIQTLVVILLLYATYRWGWEKRKTIKS